MPNTWDPTPPPRTDLGGLPPTPDVLRAEASDADIRPRSGPTPTSARKRFTQPHVEPPWWRRPFNRWSGTIILFLALRMLVFAVNDQPVAEEAAAADCVDTDDVVAAMSGWARLRESVLVDERAGHWRAVVAGLTTMGVKLDALKAALWADPEVQWRVTTTQIHLAEAASAVKDRDFERAQGAFLAIQADWRAFLSTAEASTVPAC